MMEGNKPCKIEIEPDIAALLGSPISKGSCTVSVETSKAVEKSSHNCQVKKKKKSEEPPPKCQKFSIVLNKSELDILTCFLCNKYFCSSSALESHIQEIHCTIKVKDHSLSNCRRVKNKPIRHRKAKQVTLKKLKVYKKLCNPTILDINPSKSKRLSESKTNDTEHVATSSVNVDDSCIKMETNENSNSPDNVKEEPLESDMYDLLVPKVEIEISESEFTAIVENSNSGVNNVDNTKVIEGDTQNTNIDDEPIDTFGYKCPFCNYSTSGKSTIQKHMKITNVENYEITTNSEPLLSLSFTGSYFCQVCNTKFSSQAIYDLHMKTHTKSTCEVCKFVCFAECELNRHQHQKYHNMDCYQCYICSEYFNTSVMLKVHFTTCHSNLEFKFTCQICSETFDTKISMYKHSQLEYTYGNLDFGIYRPYKLNISNPCDKNNYLDDGSASLIQIGNKKTNLYCCITCKYKFSSVYYLNQHFMSQHMRESDFDPSSILQQLLTVNDETSDSLEHENTQLDNIVIPTSMSCENVDLINQTNCIIEPELIVPDILDNETLIPEIPAKVQIEAQVIKTIPKLVKKQNKFKSIQLRVNNTSSQICSVNVQSNPTVKSSEEVQEVDYTNENFFERKTSNESTSADCPQISSNSWCQCAAANCDHSKSLILNCQKCNFQSPSLKLLSKHFKRRHLNRSKQYNDNETNPDGTVTEQALKKGRQSRWCGPRKANYYSTPRKFKAGWAKASLNMMQQKSPRLVENDCDVHEYFRCPLCKSTYDKYETYTDHFSIHCILPIFKCIICDSRFDTYSCFITHIREHDVTKINCDSCCLDVQIGDYFSDHNCMTCRKCSLCPSEVNNFTDLLTHTQNHIVTSVSMYNCMSCNFYFYTRYNLDKHIINVHKNY